MADIQSRNVMQKCLGSIMTWKKIPILYIYDTFIGKHTAISVIYNYGETIYELTTVAKR